MPILPEPLEVLLLLVAGWIGVAVVGVALPNRRPLISRVLFPIGAAIGFGVALTAFRAIGEAPTQLVLAIGLPDLPFHFRLDSLSAFFLILLGLVSGAISIFAAGYMRREDSTSPALQCLNFHIFLASMTLVLVADDAYAFMVAWESMAVASFFLVTSDHRIAEIRRAGYLYLLMAHLGALGILLCFGVLHGNGDYTFDAMRATTLTPFWATAGFLLAVYGFGAKAGILPLHVWLPEAHPAAPSPVSALMSAVMLKTAIYGLLRVIFDLLHTQIWWWGVLLLTIGLVTALFGVVFSAVQSDMKRLLAYSSIENIGLILVGIGLAVTFQAYQMGALAALALTAALYHALNHAFFKSLLFLCTGSVLHATRERALGRLGGLIRRMPWVAWTALVGTLAIAGLPPLNGFVSEWLLLQSFLFTPNLPQGYLNMLIPVAAAAVALIAALAAYVMVKFFGLIFLGQAREERLADAHDAGPWEKAALLGLAGGCVLLGVLPVQTIGMLGWVTQFLLHEDLGGIAQSGWLYLAPIRPDRASYSPLVFSLVVALVMAITWYVVRKRFTGELRRGPAWDCGFPWQTARMQDSAEGFGQPIRQIFEPLFRIERELPSPFDTKPHYRMVAGDPLWHLLYLPVVRVIERLTLLAGVLQQGRISVYLMYSFGTLLVLLLFVR